MINALSRFFNFCADRLGLFVMSTNEGGIGNTAEEIYFGFLYARRSRKKLLILRNLSIFGHPKICNREIYNLQSPNSINTPIGKAFEFLARLVFSFACGHIPATFRYVKINFLRTVRFASGMCLFWLRVKSVKPRRFIYRRHGHLYMAPNLALEKLWNPTAIEKFSWERANSHAWGEEFQRYLPISILPKKTRQCVKVLRKLGIGPNEWFVCLHVREGSYHKDPYNCRNCNIENYKQAIDAVTAAGGWVIRMGDRSMTPLTAGSRFVDYAFSDFKSELMDLYLIQNCRFYIGQNSGIIDVAHLFQKRCVMVNVTEWGITFPPRKGSLIIPKHLYSKKHGRLLSAREMFDTPYRAQDLNDHDANYVFIENSAGEIHDVVREVLTKEINEPYSPKQLELNERRKLQVRGWLESPDIAEVRKFRIASRAAHSEGTVGNNFLEMHWDSNQRMLSDVDVKALTQGMIIHESRFMG